MRSRQLSLFALSACVATVMLAGCGGSQPPLGAPGAKSQSASSSYGYNTLYSFGKRSSDGQKPMAALIDVNGTLYGTTFAGGSLACAGGCGTVFKIKPSGKEKVLHRFAGGTDGTNPCASLLAVKGVLYGTTEYGGGEVNVGTVFEISTAGVENVVYSFGPVPDGQSPLAGLIDVSGKLFGTTLSGGNGESGTVFRIATNGREKVLYSFGYGSPGENPIAGLVSLDGTLYGTTKFGEVTSSGFGYGTVFAVSRAGTERLLHAFHLSDGYYPAADLINVKGTLYGTTQAGGIYGEGTAFSITTSGDLTSLHSFGYGSDGSFSWAPLLDAHGTLYGTTSGGGAYGKGTVFSMSLSGNEKVLHSFGYGSDGATPLAGLIAVNGTLYGTTSAGGTYGDGTVFALKP